MRPVLLVALCVIAGFHAASAQPAPAKPAPALPLESVIVTATKPSEATIKNFVEARAVPTYRLGRMARWSLQICPQTVGLGDKYAKYITQRIRAAATAVGAPVDADPACRPNIEVVFTTTPQELINSIRGSDPLYLGFHQTQSEGDALARIVHPIQAWYTTMSRGIGRPGALKDGGLAYGGHWLDVGKCPIGGGVAIKSGGVHELELPCEEGPKSNGLRAADGLNSDFFNVLILADPTKLADYEVGSLADYITMLALSQSASLDSCQELSSISNMLAPSCSSTTRRISDADLAYLHALYKLPDGDTLAVQRDYIRDQMKDVLATGKGG